MPATNELRSSSQTVHQGVDRLLF